MDHCLKLFFFASIAFIFGCASPSPVAQTETKKTPRTPAASDFKVGELVLKRVSEVSYDITQVKDIQKGQILSENSFMEDYISPDNFRKYVPVTKYEYKSLWHKISNQPPTIYRVGQDVLIRESYEGFRKVKIYDMTADGFVKINNSPTFGEYIAIDNIFPADPK